MSTSKLQTHYQFRKCKDEGDQLKNVAIGNNNFIELLKNAISL